MKDRLKKLVPDSAQTRAFLTGAALTGGVMAMYIYKDHNPKKDVIINFPKGVFEQMKESGKGLALNTNQGWFTLRYHPVE